MQGPASDLNDTDFIKKAAAAGGAFDPLDNLKRQRVYLFHGYNDAIVAKSSTDATAAFYQHYLGDTNRANLYYQPAIGAGHSLVVQHQGQADLGACSSFLLFFFVFCG